jgi:SSS family solute:Na+ symporter
VVNDVYAPRHPDASDPELLRVARISSVSITLFGVALVPVFASFGSIYAAHGAFTAAVTPPLVVALMLGIFWRGYTPKAAYWTMVGGGLAIFATIIWPELITPFAHGVPMKDAGDGLFDGKNQYKFMRGFYGLVVCLVIGLLVSWRTKARPLDEVRGLVWGTVDDALRFFKGAPGTERSTPWSVATLCATDHVPEHASERAPVRVSRALGDALGGVVVGDLVYISDRRAWLGGLRSAHGVVAEIVEDDALRAEVSPAMRDVVGSDQVRVRCLY